MSGRTLPHPDSPEAPKYWAYETGGKLGPAMKRYLSGMILSIAEIELIKRYLGQWIDSPVWENNGDFDYGLGLDMLRRTTHGIRTAQDLDLCVEAMIELGMDPL